MTDSIKNLVDKKSKYVPGFLISLALKVIDSKLESQPGSIEDRAKFSLYDIEPKDYMKDVLCPAYFVVSQNDEFIVLEEFNEMFIDHPLVKALKVVPGGHADEREEFIIADIVRFVVDNFDNEDTIVSVAQYKEDVMSHRAKYELIASGHREDSIHQDSVAGLGLRRKDKDSIYDEVLDRPK